MKNLLSKCGLLNISFLPLLFALLLILQLLVSLVTLPLTANAASPYDDSMFITPDLNLGSDLVSGSNSWLCDDEDVSTFWSQWITDDSKYTSGLVTFTGNLGNTQATMKASFETALASGRWGVTQVSSVDGSMHQDGFSVFWTEDTSLGLEWFTDHVNAIGTGSNLNQVYIDCKMNDPGKYTATYSANQASAPISGYGGVFSNYFVYTDNPNYPDDYEGPDVPAEPSGPGVDIYPGVSYQVDDKKLNAQYLKNVPYQSHIDWAIWATDDDYNIPPDSEPIYYKSNVINSNPAMNYTFLKNGKYVLIADVKCVAPYLCPELPGTDPDITYDVGVTAIQLNIDGSSYSGDTDNPDCMNGVCEANNPYVDCTEFAGEAPYGFGGGSFPDIIGGIGCVWTNFGIFLGILLKTLFIPQEDFMNNFLDEFGEWLETKFGFVYTALQMLVEWLQSIIIVTPDCTLSTGGANFFGATMPNLNVCFFEDTVPTIWDAMVLFLRLFFAAVLIFLAYNRLFGILRSLGR